LNQCFFDFADFDMPAQGAGDRRGDDRMRQAELPRGRTVDCRNYPVEPFR
jgi:hypothetical protein